MDTTQMDTQMYLRGGSRQAESHGNSVGLCKPAGSKQAALQEPNACMCNALVCRGQMCS